MKPRIQCVDRNQDRETATPRHRPGLGRLPHRPR